MAVAGGTRAVLYYCYTLHRIFDPYFAISLMFGELCLYCMLQCSIGVSFYAVAATGFFSFAFVNCALDALKVDKAI